LTHHAHAARGSNLEGRLVWSVLLTSAFVLGEALAGYLSHSLALLSDAGHNFSDVLALTLSWYALRLGKRRADARRTYGYHRVGILAALANAVSLVVIALFIFWEAYQRLQSPAPVAGGVVIGVAIAAVVLNGLISLWLRSDARHDLNVRSAYLHMLGDALSAVGVLVAGLIVSLTKNPIADPVASLLIGLLLLWSSWSVLAEATNILLEAAPKGLDMPAVERAIRAVPGVIDLHDLHVWSV